MREKNGSLAKIAVIDAGSTDAHLSLNDQHEQAQAMAWGQDIDTRIDAAIAEDNPVVWLSIDIKDYPPSCDGNRHIQESAISFSTTFMRDDRSFVVDQRHENGGRTKAAGKGWRPAVQNKTIAVLIMPGCECAKSGKIIVNCHLLLERQRFCCDILKHRHPLMSQNLDRSCVLLNSGRLMRSTLASQWPTTIKPIDPRRAAKDTSLSRHYPSHFIG